MQTQFGVSNVYDMVDLGAWQTSQTAGRSVANRKKKKHSPATLCEIQIELFAFMKVPSAGNCPRRNGALVSSNSFLFP